MTDKSFLQSIRRLFASGICELRPEDGMTQEDLDSAESELGFKFPKPLRYYYEATGKSAFNQVFNRFLLPTDFWTHGGGVVFCEENSVWCITGSD